MKFSILVVLGIVCLVVSCKKEQPQPNNGLENCACAHEVNADFTIEEMTTNNPNFVKYTETDTIFAGKNVRFYAKEENATYTWYIGSEVLDSREVKRYFAETLAGQTISISLVVHKTPNLLCFPSDDGYDSITKSFVIADAYNPTTFYNNQHTNPRFEGVFRMKNENSADSLDITIEFLATGESGPGAFSLDRMNIYNLDGNGSITFCSFFTSFNYRQLWTTTSGYQAVMLHHKMDHSIELEFVQYPNYPKPIIHFKGRKIN
jgi:hypothetical protein